MAYPYYSYYPYNQYQPQSFTPEYETMRWVDGEVGAKAFQKPADLPANKPIALWDSTEERVFIKSWNQMGMANPMQVLSYVMKDNPKLPEGVSGVQNNYATKEDLENLKEQLKSISESIANLQNGSNRGGRG